MAMLFAIKLLQGMVNQQISHANETQKFINEIRIAKADVK